MTLWRQSWQRRLGLGVAGSMIDFGDHVPEDALAFDGTRGDRLHNRYALGYHRAASEVFRAVRGDSFMLFARQAAPGSQKYVGYFAGDHLTNFHGMRAALRAGVGMAMAGNSNWSVELGGYSGGWPDVETYIRWTQWAAFSPIMRCHGQTPREPWEYGDAALANYKRHAWLRYNLRPALQAYAIEAHQTDTPMMRPLPLAFPGEPQLSSVDDEYLFGPDLLVAPMAQPGLSRRVVLPRGTWTHLWSGKVFDGGATQTVAAPMTEIPVFLRAGALIPVELSPRLRWGESMTAGKVTALVVTPPQGREARSWQAGQTTLRASSETTKDGFEVTLPARTPHALLIYGEKVARARVDGRAGPLSHENERVVLRVSAGVKRVRIIRSDIAPPVPKLIQ